MSKTASGIKQFAPLFTYAALQVNPHDVPLHVATPFAGATQAVQDAPHVLTLVLSAQVVPLQRWNPFTHENPHASGTPEHVGTALAGALQGVHEVPQDWVEVSLEHCSEAPDPQAWNVLLHVMPQALPVQSGVAFATLVVHAAGAEETYRQEFESAVHVSMLLALVQTGPAWVHVGSLLQAQLAAPAAPPHTSCVGHAVVVWTRHPFESAAQVTSPPLPQ